MVVVVVVQFVLLVLVAKREGVGVSTVLPILLYLVGLALGRETAVCVCVAFVFFSCLSCHLPFLKAVGLLRSDSFLFPFGLLDGGIGSRGGMASRYRPREN